MQKKHTIFCWIFDPTFQFLCYIIYKLLHIVLYASFSSISTVLTSLFLTTSCSVLPMMSTTKQMKNVAGNQAKCIIVLGLVLKRDWHDEIKGQLPAALTTTFNIFLEFCSKQKYAPSILKVIKFWRLQLLIVQANFLYRIEKLLSYYALLITQHLFCEVEFQACYRDLLHSKECNSYFKQYFTCSSDKPLFTYQESS